MEKPRKEKKRKRRIGLYVWGLAALGCGLVVWLTWVQYRRVVLARPLFAAILRNSPESVARLLAQGADPNSRDRPTAPQNVREMLLQLFRHREQDRDENFETVLMAASRLTDPGIARMLIQRGANIRAIGPNGYAALHHAAASGSSRVAELLLERGADPNQRIKGGDTPLILTIRDDHNACFETLLQRGAKPAMANDAGETPLRFAAEKGFPTLYGPLLEHGADPNTSDENGIPLIARAIQAGREDMVSLLLHYHANVNIAGGNNPLLTALDAGASYFYYSSRMTRSTQVAIVRRLLEAGADPKIKDEEGRPALWCMIQKERPEEVELLLKAGADPESIYKGSPCLIEATSRRNPILVKLLLKHHANSDSRGEGGTTALMIAAFNDDDDIVRILLAAGAHPRITDTEGRSAFRHASRSPRTLALLHSTTASR